VASSACIVSFIYYPVFLNRLLSLGNILLNIFASSRRNARRLLWYQLPEHFWNIFLVFKSILPWTIEIKKCCKISIQKLKISKKWRSKINIKLFTMYAYVCTILTIISVWKNFIFRFIFKLYRCIYCKNKSLNVKKLMN
jgi:hypothetical protein